MAAPRRRGRPVLSDGERRHRVVTNLLRSEIEAIDKAREGTGLSRSDWLRAVVQRALAPRAEIDKVIDKVFDTPKCLACDVTNVVLRRFPPEQVVCQGCGALVPYEKAETS